MTNPKPLGGKTYGSIPHLPGSRRGPADHGVNEGQYRICCEQTRDKHDLVIVQLKLDGSNVAAAKLNGGIVALTRAGYRAETSPFEQHHMWGEWVKDHAKRFAAVLQEGEWLSGEWLAQAHGTRYWLGDREPFVAFDLWGPTKQRATYDDFIDRVDERFTTAPVLHYGTAFSIEAAMKLADWDSYGALDNPEGAVWRVERGGVVDFLAKYVRPEKIDGCYLESVTGKPAVWNWPS